MPRTILIYEDVLERVRNEIDRRWNGVENFLGDDTAMRESGILEDAGKPTLRVYLSVPAKGGAKKVKSAPVMQKLLRYLFNEDLHYETQVERKTLLWVED